MKDDEFKVLLSGLQGAQKSGQLTPREVSYHLAVREDADQILGHPTGTEDAFFAANAWITKPPRKAFLQENGIQFRACKRVLVWTGAAMSHYARSFLAG